MGPVLSLFLLGLAASPSDPVPPLATYEGGVVTAGEYADWLVAQHMKDDPAERRRNLETLALTRTLETEALAGGLDRDAAAAFRLQESERDLLVQALDHREAAAVRITDAEVEAELQAEKAELVKPRRVRLRNIFKKAPAASGPVQRAAARAAMERLRQRLQRGEDFAALALHESDSQTRFRGGAMGALPPGVLQPVVERVAFGLKTDELSPVIETAEGFTILRCDGFIEGRVMPLEEARQRIREGLWRRRTEARRRGLREELLWGAAILDLLDSALAQGGDDAVAARFLWGTVTLGELRWLSGQRPESFSVAALRSQVEEHVYRTQMADLARERGLDADPELRARIRWTRARLLATFEVTRRVNTLLVPPTPAEMRAHFETNRDRYREPPEMDFSMILLAAAATEPRRAAEAEDLAGRLRSGARDFAEAARALSAHPSGQAGGRLGWHTMRQAAPLGPALLRALGQTQPGEVVGPVQQDNDLFIAKLWGRRPARPQSFEEAQGRIETELGNARVAKLQEKVEADARKALGLQLPEAR
jgi:parvulin-like peptidyl-prolyl isomerase